MSLKTLPVSVRPICVFSIPMRGNEIIGGDYEGSQKRRAFSIPMRGNEPGEARDLHMASGTFSIPMRGNE